MHGLMFSSSARNATFQVKSSRTKSWWWQTFGSRIIQSLKTFKLFKGCPSFHSILPKIIIIHNLKSVSFGVKIGHFPVKNSVDKQPWFHMKYDQKRTKKQVKEPVFTFISKNWNMLWTGVQVGNPKKPQRIILTRGFYHEKKRALALMMMMVAEALNEHPMLKWPLVSNHQSPTKWLTIIGQPSSEVKIRTYWIN